MASFNHHPYLASVQASLEHAALLHDNMPQTFVELPWHDQYVEREAYKAEQKQKQQLERENNLFGISTSAFPSLTGVFGDADVVDDEADTPEMQYVLDHFCGSGGAAAASMEAADWRTDGRREERVRHDLLPLPPLPTPSLPDYDPSPSPPPPSSSTSTSRPPYPIQPLPSKSSGMKRSCGLPILDGVFKSK